MVTRLIRGVAVLFRPRIRWNRIAPRLLVGFLVPILLTSAIGLVAVQRFSGLSAQTTELTTRDLPEVFRVTHLRTLLYHQLDLLQTPSGAASGRALGHLIDTQRSIAAELAPLSSSTAGTRDAPLVRTLASGVRRSAALTGRAERLRVNGHAGKASDVLQHQVMPLLQKLIPLTARLRVIEQKEVAVAAAQAQSESRTATQLMLAVTLLSLPLSILLALALTRSLTRPLASLLRATTALAAGDLEASPSVTSRDEIGRLAAAFDIMRSNLRLTIFQLEVERRQTQAIIDTSSDAVILVDGRQRIVQVNPAAERLSGWIADEALGHEWWVVFGCDAERASGLTWADGDYVAVAGRNGRQNNHAAGSKERESVKQAEILAHPRTGLEHWLAVSSAPVVSNGTGSPERRSVLNFHDISDLKALDRLKSDFVAMVSHELRAPLTTVTGAVEMLTALNPSEDDEAYREVVSILGQQTQRLKMVIEEVLQVTRLEARQLPVHPEPLPLDGFLREMTQRVQREWGDDRPITIRTSGSDELVWADPTMLEIVLRNLLDNARKYTPSGSPIEMEVGRGPEPGRVSVRVTDHGPGIPAKQLDHVFDRFSRGAQSSCEWSRGYGLGLYIAQELIRSHNGEIWVESDRDGTRFTFTLWRVGAAEDHDVERRSAIV